MDRTYLVENYKEMDLYDDIDKNIDVLKTLLDKSSDVIFREFRIGEKKVKGFLVCVDGLVDKALINNNIMEPITLESRKLNGNYLSKKKRLRITFKLLHNNGRPKRSRKIWGCGRKHFKWRYACFR